MPNPNIDLRNCTMDTHREVSTLDLSVSASHACTDVNVPPDVFSLSGSATKTFTRIPLGQTLAAGTFHAADYCCPLPPGLAGLTGWYKFFEIFLAGGVLDGGFLGNFTNGANPSGSCSGLFPATLGVSSIVGLVNASGDRRLAIELDVNYTWASTSCEIYGGGMIFATDPTSLPSFSDWKSTQSFAYENNFFPCFEVGGVRPPIFFSADLLIS